MATLRLNPGYAYEYAGRNWRATRDDNWDTVVIDQSEIGSTEFVGTRRIDGSEVAVFRTVGGGPHYAQLKHSVSKLEDSRSTAWTRSNTRVDTWFERDRALVDLQTLSGDTIIEWRDEAVEEAVEDGFLSPRDWHGSAVEYANHIGAKPKRAARRRTRR